MKYIKRQAPITLHGFDGAVLSGVVSTSFTDFVNQYLLNDKKFGGSFQSIVAGSKIQVAFKSTGAEIALEDADWEVLKNAIEDPHPIVGQMTPEAGRQFLPFMRSVIDATSTSSMS